MTAIQWAVPSYRRAEVCATKTVPTLLRYGVDPAHVAVFLSDWQEADAYRAALGGTGVAVVPGVPTLRAQRRLMQHHYPRGTRLVMVDDDLADVVAKSGDAAGKLVPLPVALPLVAEHAFNQAAEAGAAMWGVCGAANGMFLKHTETAGLRYLIGAMTGVVTPNADYAGEVWPLSHGEDFAMCLASFSRLGVLYRLDWVAAKTTYFAAGGIDAEAAAQGTARAELHAGAMYQLAAQWPGLATAYVKPGGVVNVRLNTSLTSYKVPRPREMFGEKLHGL